MGMYANPARRTPQEEETSPQSIAPAIAAPARRPAFPLSPGSILALQRSAGNQAVARSLQREPAAASEAPAPVTDVASLPAHEKLLRALGYAGEEAGPAIVDELKGLITPESVVMMSGFVAVYLGAQLTPAGWVADGLALTALTISAVFVGAALFEIINDLVSFIDAVNATSEAQLRAAGAALARAGAKTTVGVLIALLTHAALEGGGGTGYDGPPSTAMADLVTAEGLIVRVPVEAVGELAPGAASPALMVPPPGGSGSGNRKDDKELSDDEKWREMEDAVRKQEEETSRQQELEEAGPGTGADPVARRIAEGHAYEHDGEFPELADLSDEEAIAVFTDLVQRAMSDPRTQTKTSGNRTAYWWPGGDGHNPMLVITDTANADGGTAFRPSDGKAYFDRWK